MANTVAFCSDYNVSILSKFTNGSTWVHPPVLAGSVLFIFLVLCVMLWCCVCLCSSCVLCVQCFRFLWIAYSWLPLRFSHAKSEVRLKNELLLNEMTMVSVLTRLHV